MDSTRFDSVDTHFVRKVKLTKLVKNHQKLYQNKFSTRKAILNFKKKTRLGFWLVKIKKKTGSKKIKFHTVKKRLYTIFLV